MVKFRQKLLWILRPRELLAKRRYIGGIVKETLCQVWFRVVCAHNFGLSLIYIWAFRSQVLSRSINKMLKKGGFFTKMEKFQSYKSVLRGIFVRS